MRQELHDDLTNDEKYPIQKPVIRHLDNWMFIM